MSSTPNFQSDIVLKHKHQLQIIDDFYNGVDTAKNHLLKYATESDEVFKIRKELARLTNYTRESVETIGALIFRKNLNVSAFEKNQLYKYFDKIDLVNSFDVFAKDTLKNLSKDGITYILVEKQEYNDVVSKADESEARPYVINIKRRDVLNYELDTDGNFLQFTYNEIYTTKDGYKTTDYAQQRCYRYNDDGVCLVEIWREDKLFDVKEVEIGFIPIVQIGSDFTPYIYDLAVQNKNHFNLMNEQRDYVRQLAKPQRITYGLDTSGAGKIIVGVSDAINFDAPKSEAGMEIIELTGQSSAVIESLILKDEEDMKKFIIGLLESDVQRTAKEVSVANSTNNATLGEYATMLENGLNESLSIMGIYQGLEIVDFVLVNREYADETLSGEQVRELKDLYLNGVISWDKLVESLVKGKVLEFNSTEDIEIMKNQVVMG